MLKGIFSKKTNIDKEAFECLHKEMLKVFAIDLSGRELFDAKKYGEMSRIQFSENGVPEDIIVTVKQSVHAEIVNVDMSIKNSTKEELVEAFAEHNRLS